VSTQLDFATNAAVSRRNIGYVERRDLADPHPSIDRQNERKPISLGVTRRLDDAKDPLDFGVGENRSLSHGEHLS
jgi:hypothetical protein